MLISDVLVLQRVTSGTSSIRAPTEKVRWESENTYEVNFSPLSYL